MVFLSFPPLPNASLPAVHAFVRKRFRRIFSPFWRTHIFLGQVGKPPKAPLHFAFQPTGRALGRILTFIRKLYIFHCRSDIFGGLFLCAKSENVYASRRFPQAACRWLPGRYPAGDARGSLCLQGPGRALGPGIPHLCGRGSGSTEGGPEMDQLGSRLIGAVAQRATVG